MPNRTLRDLLRGRGAHADPIACVSGIPFPLAGRTLDGVPQTIWQLVWHMNYWMDYELRSIAGPEVAYPARADDSWPSARPPGPGAWEEEVARFRRQIDRLVELAGVAVQDGTGARIVHADRNETVQDILWQLAAHNSYHVGQVVQLRRALGAWPPPGGGDTW